MYNATNNGSISAQLESIKKLQLHSRRATPWQLVGLPSDSIGCEETFTLKDENLDLSFFNKNIQKQAICRFGWQPDWPSRQKQLVFLVLGYHFFSCARCLFQAVIISFRTRAACFEKTYTEGSENEKH